MNAPRHIVPHAQAPAGQQPRSKVGPAGAQAAFSLLELMMVILVTSILIGLVIGLSRRAESSANTGATVAELGNIHHGLNEFYLKNNHYPEPDGVATNMLPQLKPWIDARTDGIDPWGTPYRYIYKRETNPNTYQLFSLGPDRAEGDRQEEGADNVFFREQS